MITMLQNSSIFCRMPNEDPNIHLAIFLEICNASKFNRVTDDAVRLRLFPFSLKDKAKLWLPSESQDSIRPHPSSECTIGNPFESSEQMADKSITYPDGIIEDVLVKSIPDYLTKTLIDVERLTVKVGNEKATFKFFEPITFHGKAKENETLSHPLVHASTSKAKKPRVAEPNLYLDEPKPYDPGRNELEEL
ncbi:unnamed protein product [Prunus brigantina]